MHTAFHKQVSSPRYTAPPQSAAPSSWLPPSAAWAWLLGSGRTLLVAAHRFIALGQHRRDLFFLRSVVRPKSNRELSTVRLVIKQYSMRVRIVVPLVVVLSTSVTMHAGVQAAVVPGARWIGTTHRDLRSETMHVRSDQSEVRCANNAWLTCSIREMTTNSRTWQKERSTVYCSRSNAVRVRIGQCARLQSECRARAGVGHGCVQCMRTHSGKGMREGRRRAFLFAPILLLCP